MVYCDGRAERTEGEINEGGKEGGDIVLFLFFVFVTFSVLYVK